MSSKNNNNNNYGIHTGLTQNVGAIGVGSNRPLHGPFSSYASASMSTSKPSRSNSRSIIQPATFRPAVQEAEHSIEEPVTKQKSRRTKTPKGAKMAMNVEATRRSRRLETMKQLADERKAKEQEKRARNMLAAEEKRRAAAERKAKAKEKAKEEEQRAKQEAAAASGKSIRPNNQTMKQKKMKGSLLNRTRKIRRNKINSILNPRREAAIASMKRQMQNQEAKSPRSPRSPPYPPPTPPYYN